MLKAFTNMKKLLALLLLFGIVGCSESEAERCVDVNFQKIFFEINNWSLDFSKSDFNLSIHNLSLINVKALDKEYITKEYASYNGESIFDTEEEMIKSMKKEYPLGDVNMYYYQDDSHYDSRNKLHSLLRDKELYGQEMSPWSEYINGYIDYHFKFYKVEERINTLDIGFYNISSSRPLRDANFLRSLQL